MSTAAERAEAHTRDEAAVREAIADHVIGFTSRGGAGTAYRWWLTEHDYRLLTPGERRALRALLDAGEARSRSGWQHHKGLVLLAGDNWL